MSDAQRTDLTADDVALYQAPSETKSDVVWHPVVSLHTGVVDCDCPDFCMRKVPLARSEGCNAITVASKHRRYWCKHTAESVLNCVARDEFDIIVKAR